MDRLIYKKGNLFNAPSNAFLLHACNCLGSFGAGVALSFKNLYPRLYDQYHNECKKYFGNKRSPLVGTSFIALDDIKKRKMICLFTSQGYGKFCDSPNVILSATESALIHLSNNRLINGEPIEIHSPKINAGQDTEIKIIDFLNQNKNVTWTVWEL
jgi:ADP-ribose 1''-phosphate phosphatase